MKTFLCRALWLLIPVILASGCTESVNYDIEEVAPAEFLSDEEDDCVDEACMDPSHDHEEHEHEEHIEESVVAESGELLHDLGLHQHGTGVRNHGTEWFFNQPWAASFVWGKMLRDSIILLILAASVLLLPRLLRKRK